MNAARPKASQTNSTYVRGTSRRNQRRRDDTRAATAHTPRDGQNLRPPSLRDRSGFGHSQIDPKKQLVAGPWKDARSRGAALAQCLPRRVTSAFENIPADEKKAGQGRI